MSTLDTLTLTATAHGWTDNGRDYVGQDSRVFARGSRRVSITVNKSGALQYASNGTVDQPTNRTELGPRDAGKRETVLAWLRTFEYPVPTAEEAAVVAVDTFTYPVPTAEQAAVVATSALPACLSSATAPCLHKGDEHNRAGLASIGREGSVPTTYSHAHTYPVPTAEYGDDAHTWTDANGQTEEQAVRAKIDTDIADARVALSDAVMSIALVTSIQTHVRWHATPDAPDSYDALRAVWGAEIDRLEDGALGGSLAVFDGACDATLYSTPAHNHAFRYWHDTGHVKHSLSFTPGDEKRLQLDHHLSEIEAAGIAYHSLAWWLYYADTIGQIEYVEVRGEFPTDQLSFVCDYALDKIDGGDGTWAVHIGDYSL